MANTTEKTELTNDLRHSILAHDSEGNLIYIKIRLNDECKNGHQDFSITADIYQKGKPKIDRYLICGGCCHDEILKARPDLKIFVDLHLSDYNGVPYAVESGFYHLRNGFNSIPIESDKFKDEFCEYYRITPAQFDELNKSKNQLQYALFLDKLGILKKWEKQAQEAIFLLEKWTNKKFLIDSVKSQYHAPTIDEVIQEQERQNNGYYSEESERQRDEEKKEIELKKIIKEEKEEINKIKLEYSVKREVLIKGGKKLLDNCIFYNHSKTLSFNWRGYDKIPHDFLKDFIKKLQLPESVKIQIK